MAKVINQGKLEPVVVVLGEVDMGIVKNYDGGVVGEAPSISQPGQTATWISFSGEGAEYRMSQFIVDIERGF